MKRNSRRCANLIKCEICDEYDNMLLKKLVVSWKIEIAYENIWKLMNFFVEVDVVQIPRS